MKPLRGSLLDDDLVDNTDKMIKDEIEAFLIENYNYKGSIKISREPNTDGKYEVSSTTDVGVTNRHITSLTNGMFIWTTVGGYFNCAMCYSLKSLVGAPKKVGGSFYCDYCAKLESLEGAPKKVGGGFNCSFCGYLKSLDCAPKEVRRNFYCLGCAGEFTEDDVKKVSNVKGKIIC